MFAGGVVPEVFGAMRGFPIRGGGMEQGVVCTSSSGKSLEVDVIDTFSPILCLYLRSGGGKKIKKIAYFTNKNYIGTSK